MKEDNIFRQSETPFTFSKYITYFSVGPIIYYSLKNQHKTHQAGLATANVTCYFAIEILETINDMSINHPVAVFLSLKLY